MRFRFIEEHRYSFPANRLCDVVGVSTRGLRAFRSRPASRRQRSDLVTLAHIKEQSRLSLGSYSRPRMTEELKEIGLDVGHRRVGRLMRQNGIPSTNTGCSAVMPRFDVSWFSSSRVNQRTEGDVRDISAVIGNIPDTPVFSSLATTRSPCDQPKVADWPLASIARHR